jgi:hypothetical protein
MLRSGAKQPASRNCCAKAVYRYFITQFLFCNFRNFAMFAAVSLQTTAQYLYSLHTEHYVLH